MLNSCDMKKWIIRNNKKLKIPVGDKTHPSLAGRQSAKLKVAEIVELLLENRGVKTKKEIETFLNPKLEDLTVEKVGIDKKNLGKAIARVKKAIENKEKIVIYGDYDTDGICATAILWETIYALYKNVLPYIPDRLEEGYGLSIKGISNLMLENSKPGIIITVDNGIMAQEAVSFANKNGIDIIITDHHVLPDKLPEAAAIVHTTKLCGAGIAYLFAKELIIHNSEFRVGEENRDNHLELAAIATITDLVPLTGVNRVIVQKGLEELRRTTRLGFLQLFKKAGIEKESINVYEIGHVIGPRFNATGRISNALEALRLICARNEKKAEKLADLLDRTNKERQILTEETFLQAKSYFTEITSSAKIIFSYHREYNQGIIGLVASRLVEEFYKPSFVLSVGEKYSKGSARSIKGFNIIEFIRSVPDLLIASGGHPMAAGFTVETEKIELLKKTFEEKAEKIIPGELLKRGINIDMELEFSSINLELYRAMQNLAPFGAGNPEPIFVTYGVIVREIRKVGRTGGHLKLLLEQKGVEFEAIAFGIGNSADIKIADRINVAYSIDENVWNGNRKLQLKVKDVKEDK